MKILRNFPHLAAFGVLFLGACTCEPPPLQGFEVKFLVASALEQFCNQAANQFNLQQPKLDNGEAFYLSCQAMGSGDVVTTLLTKAEQLQAGRLPPDSPEFPTLVSVDGEIYHRYLHI